MNFGHWLAHNWYWVLAVLVGAVAYGFSLLRRNTTSAVGSGTVVASHTASVVCDSSTPLRPAEATGGPATHSRRAASANPHGHGHAHHGCC